MNAKDTARHVIESLSQRASIDDVIRALYVASKFDRGDRETVVGKGVSDKQAMERLARWQK